MKAFLILACSVLTGASSLCAQWTTGSGGTIYYTGGSVGVGVTTPQPSTLGVAASGFLPASNLGSALTLSGQYGGGVLLKDGSGYLGIWSTGSGTQLNFAAGGSSSGFGNNYGSMMLTSAGYLGIGTNAPGRLLHLSASGQPGFAMSDIRGGQGNQSMGFIYDAGIALTKPGLVFQDLTDSGGFVASHLTIFKDGSVNFGGITAPAAGVVAFTGGSVGIGTTSPQHLLHVAGTIGAEEVIVSSTGADYVFDPGYRLEPLGDVARYVQENHHLPGIPSATEMQQKGLSVGEMQSKLLAKIEELTLYMIQANERNTRLEEQNRELRDEIRDIRERIAR